MVKVSKKSIEKFKQATRFKQVPFKQLSSTFKQFPQAGLNKEQFAKCVKNIFQPKDDELLSSIFDYLDLDDNGTLDAGELLCAFNIFTSGSVEEKIEGCFLAFDADQNNSLDRDEFNHMLKTTLCTSRDLLIDLLGYFAGNEDPKTADRIRLKSLKSDEVEVLAAAAFDLADENNDGVIELSEFQRWALNSENMVDFFNTYDLLFK